MELSDDAVADLYILMFAQEYVSLSFSSDGKMLLAQGGAPEYNLVLWVWEKSKVAAVAKTTNQQGSPVYSVSAMLPDKNLLLG